MGAQISGGKGPLTLNLTALIDISALIVIFLIMGTMFGQSSIEIPNGLDLPKSINKDTINSAPDITINGDVLSVPFLNKQISLAELNEEQSKELESLARKYLQEHPRPSIQPNVMINFIADKELPYRDIFRVLKPFRAAGFETVLFVARGK